MPKYTQFPIVQFPCGIRFHCLIREILKTLTDAIDGDGYGIRYLVLKRIPSLITIMEEFIQMGLGSGDDEEPAVPETELKRSR